MKQSAVRIPPAGLNGEFVEPANAAGVIVFAHGSGSSRHSPRNRYVAGELHQSGFATLLMDLLTEEEERIDARTALLRFDIDLLAERLVYFGASTGAAAALVAASRLGGAVRAVVSRGGGPTWPGQRWHRWPRPRC